MPEDSKYTLIRPLPGDGYAPLNAQNRTLFCQSLKNGCRSRAQAMRACRLNPTTVNRWIRFGKMTADEWAFVTGKNPDLNESDEYSDYRDFFLTILQAEAARDAKVDMVLAENALADWHAADALGKRQERMAVFEDVKRIKKFQAIAAEHEARFAKAKADAAEQGGLQSAGTVIFPDQMLELFAPAAREILEAEMKRIGLQKATQEAAVAAAASLSEEDLDEIETLTRKYAEEGKDEPSLS